MQDKKETSFDKIISASSRFRPSETIVFDPPLEGKNGAKLTSYTWSYEWTMKPSSEGELVSKRVSDWTQAEISADTGRDIVHQYTILMPNGDSKTVSSDSVPVLLGYLDKKELKSFPNLVTASKTLAKQQMQLAILEAQKKEYDELYSKFEKAEKPEIKEVGEDSKFLAATERYKKGAYSNYAMGDVIYKQDNDYVYGTESYNKRPISKDTIEQLTSFWISKRVEENGGVNPRELYDLKNRVARQKRKVENILNAKSEKMVEEKKELDSADSFDWSSVYAEFTPEEEAALKLKQEIEAKNEKENWYQQSKWSKKYAPTYKDAVEKMKKEYLDGKKTFEDWGSRVYKSNKGVVFAGGDDIHGEAYTIGGINEHRKKNRMMGAKMQMDEAIANLKELGVSENEINELVEQKENKEIMSKIKGITEIQYEDDGKTIIYGSKNNKTRISVKNMTEEDIKEEFNFEKKMLENQKTDLPNKIKNNEYVQNSMSSSLKEKDDSRKLLDSAKKNIEILESIVVPFYEEKLKEFKLKEFKVEEVAEQKENKEMTKEIKEGQVYLNTTNNKKVQIDKVEGNEAEFPSVYYHIFGEEKSYRNSNIDRLSLFEDLVEKGAFVLIDSELTYNNLELKRDWKVQGRTISNSKIGEKLSENEANIIIKQIVEHPLNKYNGLQLYYNKENGTIKFFGDTDLVNSINEEIGNKSLQKIKRQEKLDKTSEEKTEKENIQLNYINSKKIESDWIDNVFGENSLNDFNKIELIKYISGESKAFGGLLNYKMKEGLNKIGAITNGDVDFKKIKQSFEQYINLKKELEKGNAVEMEHKETLEKVATGEITPEEGVLETAETHIAEDPKYYDKLEAIEMSFEKQAELKSFKQRVELLLRREYSKTITDKLMEENNAMIEGDFNLLRTADRTFREIKEAHEKPQKDKYNSLINNAGINSERVDNWNQVPVVWKNTKPISKVNFVNTPYNKELIKLLDVFAGNDALRPVMSGIHFDGNGITATNAHKLISLPYPNPEYNGTYATIPKRDYSYDKDIKDDLFVSTKFPNYEAVIPKAENAIGVYKFSVYKALQYTRVALKFTNKYTNQIAFSFGDMVIAFNGEWLAEIFETALKLGHDTLYSFTSAPNRAIVLSPDRNYEVGKSEVFLLMPVILNNDAEDYKGGAEDLDFAREIKVYYDFSTDAIYNSNETLAEFKMNYGEYDILKPAEIKALDKYAGNNSIIPALDNFKVQDGKVFANNLDTTFTIKGSDLKDGLYRVLNGAIEYNGHETLSSFDDYPKLEIEGGVQLSFIINSEVLKFYIEKAIDFTGNDDLRPVMSGICFDYNNGKLFMVATDAHKMFRVDITEYVSEISDKKDFQFILSKNNLMKFLKVLDETPVEVKAYNKNVELDTDDYNFVSKTIDGKYPNYNSVISAFKNKKITINVKDLFICLKSKEAQDFIKKHKKEDVMLIDRAGSKENELDLYLFIFENTRDNSSRKIEDEVKICTVKYKYEEGTYQTHSNVILLMPIMNNEDTAHFAFREKFFREILDVVNCEDVEIFYDEKNRAYLIDGDCFKYKHTIQAVKKSPVKASVVEEVRTEKEIVEQEEKDKEVIEEQFNEPDADLIDRGTTGAGTSDAEDAIVLLNDLLEDAKGKQKKTILEAINLLKDLLDEPTDEKKEVRGEYQKGYEDLYLPDVVEMPINTTIEQLINEYDKYSGGKSNAVIKFRLGNRELIAHRKYTFQGRNVVKTKYIHIEWVDDFNKKHPIVYKTWKETKSGIKETTNPSINDWNRKNK